MKAVVVSIALAFSADSLAAQDTDCSNPQTQMEMNHCAGLEYQAADEDLNADYRMARDAMKQLDEYLPDGGRSAAQSLLDAQRAWIAYRDAACETEGFLFRGGSMEPLIVLTCKTDLTRKRSEALRFLAEEN